MNARTCDAAPSSELARKIVLFIAAMLVVGRLRAAPLPYDANADATVQVSQGLQLARASGKKLLLVFGANWCPDCRRLDPKIGAAGGVLDPRQFVIVKIDVGNFNRNIALAHAFGNPIRKGIPGAAIVGPDRKILYAGPLSHLLEPGRRIFKFAVLVIGIGVLVASGLMLFFRWRRSG